VETEDFGQPLQVEAVAADIMVAVAAETTDVALDPTVEEEAEVVRL
jgi:hypothetical protein